MHVHARDSQMTKAGSGKLFVNENGDSVVKNKGNIEGMNV